jgi:membrane protein DedA with SNARE-associated domain
MNALPDHLLTFISSHSGWAAPLVLALAFCESSAFISLIVPATVILIGVGGLLGLSAIGFWSVWLSACAGAVAGDWVAYELARWYGDKVGSIWPLSRHPEILINARTFVQRWGVSAIFLGRFFGPLRAIVPLVAGACGMSRKWFQVANLASAVAWATAVLAPGYYGLPRLLLG